MLAMISSCQQSDEFSQTNNNFTVVEETTVHQVNTPLTEEQQQALFDIIKSNFPDTKSYPLEEITPDNNLYLMSVGRTYVVMFGGSWCPHCQFSKQNLEDYAMSCNISYVRFAYCDVANNEEIAKTFRVQAIPTTIVIKDMVVAETIIGYVSPEALDDIVQRYAF